MIDADIATPYDLSPELALVAINAHRGPLLLDLDETLYLRNSTEDFLDSAYPQLPALLLLRMLDVLKPWRWTGGAPIRDLWRIKLIRLFFPWTSSRWRARVPSLAAEFVNRPLVAAVKASSAQTIIVTAGFQPIVTPLVAALGLPDARIVAARSTHAEDRRRGKLCQAIDALGAETVGQSMVVTDSSQDTPLLQACSKPVRTLWPGAHYRTALSEAYLPGRYLTQVKRPGERYIVHGILLEDFAFWLLSSVALAAVPVLHVLGMLCLLLSFWSIYEHGYVDNDIVGSRFEEDPKLSAAFKESQLKRSNWLPWIWALLLGALAISLLRWPGQPAPVDLLIWVGVLVATYLWFWWYNRMDKVSRVWLFAGLQFARSAAFVAVVPIVPIASAAIGAHVLARWMPYYVYRFGGKSWPEAPAFLTRLLFFIVLSCVLTMALGPSLILNYSAMGMLAWNVYRARTELATAFKKARRLDRPADKH